MAKEQLRALIFDLDGTLIDSEPNYYKGDKEFIENHGGEYSRERFQSFIGMGSVSLIQWLKKNYDVTEPMETLLKEKDSLYRKYAKENTRVFPEMLKMVKTGETLNLPMAVASGSSKEVILEILNLTGLRRYFQVLLSSEEVKNGKPEADIFIETARRINARPEECLVFEDSLYGLTAGLKANMKVVFIPSVPERNREEYRKAQCLYPEGMAEFSAGTCWSWIHKNFTIVF